MKFKIDDLVIYRPFRIYSKEIKCIILSVCPEEDYHDYEIFLDDGTSRIKKVKEEFLSEIEE